MKICNVSSNVELHKIEGAYVLVTPNYDLIVPDEIGGFPLTEALALLEQLAQFYMTWVAVTPTDSKPDLLKAMAFDISKAMTANAATNAQTAH